MSSAVAAEVEPPLTVVLSTLGNYASLERVLDAYSDQRAPAGTFEMVVVVDKADARPAAVDEAIGTRPYPVRRLRGRIPGLSANRNTGWAAARSDLILLADNDTIPVTDFVGEHLSWHRRHPDEHVAVLGHVRWARELKLTPFMRWLDQGFQFDYPAIRGVEADWAHLYGANSSIKKRFIQRVGGWDEERVPYLYDDLDWSYRASKHGLRVLYNRRAVVDHLRYDTTLAFWKEKARRLAAAEHRFSQLHPELPPWFHRIFTEANAQPPARGRGLRLAPYVPPWVPWLGPRVWTSVDMFYRQALAPHFLDGWREAEAEPGPLASG